MTRRNVKAEKIWRWAVVCQAKHHPEGTETLIRNNDNARCHFDSPDAAESWLAARRAELEGRFGCTGLRVRKILCWHHGEACGTIFDRDKECEL